MNQLHVAALVVAFGGMVAPGMLPGENVGYLFFDRPAIHSTMDRIIRENPETFGNDSANRTLIAYVGFDRPEVTSLLTGDEDPEMVAKLPVFGTDPDTGKAHVFHGSIGRRDYDSGMRYDLVVNEGEISLTLQIDEEHYGLQAIHDI